MMTASTWLARPRPRPHAGLRLLCLPYAGAGAAMFRAWPEILSKDIEVCPVRLPGRENRLTEPPCTRLAPLVSRLAQALVPLLDLPYVIFGHSMGALIGFELARELRQRFATSPAHLILSGRPAPRLPPRERPIHELPDDAFVDELCLYGGMPHEVLENPELMELLLPTLRADFAIVETYEYSPQEPLDCPLTVFGGTDDPKVPAENLHGWRQETDGEFSLRLFEGGHQFLDERREEFFRALEEPLERALHRDPTQPEGVVSMEHTGLETAARTDE